MKCYPICREIMRFHSWPQTDRQMPASVNCEIPSTDARPIEAVGFNSCVVIAPRECRRAPIDEGVREAQWRPNCCERISDSLRLLWRSRARLVLVDLADLREDERDVIERVAESVSRAGGLLIVFGAPDGDESVEVQARQLGAWVYVAGELASNRVAELCREARNHLGRPDCSLGAPFSEWVPQFVGEACC
jgi:hypothetical protein